MCIRDRNNNSALWNPRTNSKNGFNARNYLFTNTELDIVDGAQLSITYWGQYQFGPKAACPPNGCFSQFLKLGTPGTFSGIPLNAANSGFLLPSSQFKFSNPVLGINGFPTDASIQQGYSDAASNRALETLGLRASTGKIMNSTFKADIPKEQQYFDTGGYTIDKQNFYISFYGTLTGYSNTFSRLGIAPVSYTHLSMNSHPLSPHGLCQVAKRYWSIPLRFRKMRCKNFAYHLYSRPCQSTAAL